jgi:GNAT superfamily N-acetyltransferase
MAMTKVTVQLETKVRRSFRVEQVAGMFDVPIEERVRHELTAEVPGLEESWTIGAIVGPSGSGKTTLARAAFGDAVYKRRAWPRNKAIIDCFGDVPVKLLAHGLVAVGLGSPPTWLKPYEVLSTGQRFRAELLRAMLGIGRNRTRRRGDAETLGADLPGSDAPRRNDCLVVMDEFTGSLDRTIAKTTCAALGRLLRAQGTLDQKSEAEEPGLRFVAVTCHRDILPWLAPDWILELGAHGTAPRLVRGQLRRPGFQFAIERVAQSVWTRFSGEHYLSGGLAASATCYGALWNREPVAFCAVVGVLGCQGMKRIQRLVTLPEFQGMGIGGKLLDTVAAHEWQQGFRVTITASHPAVIAHCGRSELWRCGAVKKTGSTRQTFQGREVPSSSGRAVVAFEFEGGAGVRG